MTSETLAKSLRTNPVVIRRTMAGLREQRYVLSEKGHGGGWQLACDLSQVTLRDVYSAVGAPTLLAVSHRSETPECLVEQSVNAALDGAFHEAEALLLTRLGEVTLADLNRDVRKRQKRRVKTKTK